MKKDPKITVFGVGGVGGAIGAMLAKTYGDQVSFIARGARKEHLLQEGLTIRGDYTGSFTVKPGAVTDEPYELGEQDIVLVCVKNDALSAAAQKIRPIVGENTLVIPVMNGVTAYRRLRGELPKGIVLPSVIYIVSMSCPDFSIEQKGKFMEVHTGVIPGDEAHAKEAFEACRLFAASGINWQYSEEVLTDIWKKYVLNCAYNVVTARWGCNVGEIKADPAKTEDYRVLMEEAKNVGCAQGVELPDTLVDEMMGRLIKTKGESTSSLSRDFAEGKVGEMEVFSGDLVRMAAASGVYVPLTQQYYEAMQKIAAGFKK
ncbi:MAG: 2-dehydropantoate 2-reductase [Stomatobaculum sp.]|nr:2-dehydropantoate 2-reductase [Stomatobaculum sp.]